MIAYVGLNTGEAAYHYYIINPLEKIECYLFARAYCEQRDLFFYTFAEIF